MTFTRKKKKYTVAVNQAYLPLGISKNSFVTNPNTGTPLFGQFPLINVPNSSQVFPQAPIYLKAGDHWGPNKGYGVVHIWQEHFNSQTNYQAALPLAVALVNKIIVPGARIFYEYGTGSDAGKCTVFKSTHGLAIVTLKTDGQGLPYYSIITVYPSRRVHGQEIGKI